MTTLHDFEAAAIGGKRVPLSDYAGQVVLVVNTASACGFTPQFDGLEKLYQRYKGDGLVVLGFPCNQFGGQDPDTDDQIASFCRINYGVTFPMHSKVHVNGSDTHPLFAQLKSGASGVLGTEAIKWNFTKFLVGRDGEILDRFAPKTTPEELTVAVEAALRR